MAAQKFSINTPLGIAGGIFIANLMEGDKMPDFWKNLDPNMKGAALVFAGDFLPKQKFVKNAIKGGDMRDGLGAGLQATGIRILMEENNVLNGIGQSRRLKDDDILAVAIEGDADDYDDLDVVNDDILSDDYEDDLDIVNDDVLADSHEDDYMDDDYMDDDEDDDDDTIWDD